VTGSSYIPIVVPIMAFVAMSVWIGLVFYADSHPGWKPRRRHVGVTAPADRESVPEARSADTGTGPAQQRKTPVGASR